MKAAQRRENTLNILVAAFFVFMSGVAAGYAWRMAQMSEGIRIMAYRHGEIAEVVSIADGTVNLSNGQSWPTEEFFQNWKGANVINKAIIVGNLGRDPEAITTAGGTEVCKFSVATSERWTDKNTGEKQERTEWHRIVTFGKLAGICGQYLAKGSRVYLEGKIQTREWEDQDGNRRWTTEIVAHEMKMLGGKSDGNIGRPVSRTKPDYDHNGVPDHQERTRAPKYQREPENDFLPF